MKIVSANLKAAWIGLNFNTAQRLQRRATARAASAKKKGFPRNALCHATQYLASADPLPLPLLCFGRGIAGLRDGGKAGHEATLVATGSSAVEKALAFQPDVAVIGIDLPEMDGCAVAKALSSTPGFDGLHLIAMSGYGEEHDRARAM